jgi:hypothetical protein
MVTAVEAKFVIPQKFLRKHDPLAFRAFRHDSFRDVISGRLGGNGGVSLFVFGKQIFQQVASSSIMETSACSPGLSTTVSKGGQKSCRYLPTAV